MEEKKKQFKSIRGKPLFAKAPSKPTRGIDFRKLYGLEPLPAEDGDDVGHEGQAGGQARQTQQQDAGSSDNTSGDGRAAAPTSKRMSKSKKEKLAELSDEEKAEKERLATTFTRGGISGSRLTEELEERMQKVMERRRGSGGYFRDTEKNIGRPAALTIRTNKEGVITAYGKDLPAPGYEKALKYSSQYTEGR